MGKLNVDDIICKVLNVGTPCNELQKVMAKDDIIALCHIAMQVFLSQPPMVEVEPPIKICGDTHGQYGDLLRLFDRGGFPPLVNYLFMGDYVDRGHQNLETIILLICYKIRYPNNFFLLRGNHECQAINQVYGFFEECCRRYNPAVYLAFQDLFATMPYTGLVAGKILCMHGGLSPKLRSLEQLKTIQRNFLNPPNPSMLLDLLWADPDIEASGWEESTRGVSYVFGPDVVHDSLKQLGIDLVARAHQVVQDGYEFFANKKLVTVFSAPHYCGQFDNAAAMMHVDEQLVCSFHVMKPSIKITKVAAAGRR